MKFSLLWLIAASLRTIIDSSNSNITEYEVSAGLLSDLQNPNESLYYSTDIKIDKANQLLNDKKYIYRSACKDAYEANLGINIYLENIFQRADQYLKKNTVWDRHLLIENLNEIAKSRGKFVCLLAGKSTGKSMVLEDIVRRNKRKVILVDLRTNLDILEGLITVLKKKQPKLLQEVFRKFLGKSEEFIENKPSLKLSLDSMFFGKPKIHFELLVMLLEELVKCGHFTTLVVDEANLVLSVDENSTPELFQINKAVLNAFTKLTKQKRQLNVILVSSEHAFPFHLRQFHFNTRDITSVIYAGEIPPHQMFKLLREEWGIQDRLATALISHYGGHIYDTYLALHRLKSLNDKFWAFDSDRYNAVIECLDDAPNKPKMVEILKQLVEKGFANIRKEMDPLAELISKKNVGGVVKSTGITIDWLPEQLWGKHKLGIVPSSQSMRLVIASVLYDEELYDTDSLFATKQLVLSPMKFVNTLVSLFK